MGCGIRIRPAVIASLVLSALLVVGLARYSSQFTWTPASRVYAALIADVALIGVLGLLHRRPGPGPGETGAESTSPVPESV
jgi:hypothetical protein